MLPVTRSLLPLFLIQERYTPNLHLGKSWDDLKDQSPITAYLSIISNMPAWILTGSNTLSALLRSQMTPPSKTEQRPSPQYTGVVLSDELSLYAVGFLLHRSWDVARHQAGKSSQHRQTWQSGPICCALRLSTATFGSLCFLII